MMYCLKFFNLILEAFPIPNYQVQQVRFGAGLVRVLKVNNKSAKSTKHDASKDSKICKLPCHGCHATIPSQYLIHQPLTQANTKLSHWTPSVTPTGPARLRVKIQGPAAKCLGTVKRNPAVSTRTQLLRVVSLFTTGYINIYIYVYIYYVCKHPSSCKISTIWLITWDVSRPAKTHRINFQPSTFGCEEMWVCELSTVSPTCKGINGGWMESEMTISMISSIRWTDRQNWLVPQIIQLHPSTNTTC